MLHSCSVHAWLVWFILGFNFHKKSIALYTHWVYNKSVERNEEGNKMERKLYVEDQEMVKEISSITDYWKLEKLAEENGWFFEVDDMDDYYLSRSEDCEAFEEAQGVDVI